MTPKKPSKAAITKALKTILDPELFVSIVDLGLVYDVSEKEGAIKITMTLTTIGCPLFQTIENEVKEKVSAIPNVKSVEVELTFDPPWDPSRLSENAKAELGME
ncbi:MAG: iron-sulfur cluster assembly protein [Candidatus Moraniibacteriota bacterium]